MILLSQQESLAELEKLCASDRHSILLEGVTGCGKTYLAQQYANMLGIPDFQQIEPTVSSIRDAIDTCLMLDNRVVLCIENLDKGVPAASYTLLKFLEEPTDNAYIVVTCRNVSRIPDTIVSRSAAISISPPVRKDIDQFASTKHSSRYPAVCSRNIWKCVKTFGEVDTVMRLTDSQLDYLESLSALLSGTEPVSTMMWKLGHFPDNSETPVELGIRYLMELNRDPHFQHCGISCIRDMAQANIAPHIALAKFCFDIRYSV